ncbi:DUF3014 domain-containing protein [Xanthomonas maliensis]|uniref:DUF3014 domain-containing protein n=1 Tax=Xanthomonas maliensis TaxID=1321368 RepID=UPI0003A5E977|nr:DUF3014 domain-containing protein [Xanthomonas maliensis]KAB7772297.1 DUF3014 domain-containing protein [Xanthomonas maliensis]
MQRQSPLWPWLLAIPLLLGAAWWLFGPDSQGPDATPAPAKRAAAAVAALTTGKPPAADAEPRHPLPAASTDAADAAIPTLGKSDEAALQALQDLLHDDTALALVLREHLIQRAVVMIDNLTQPSISRRALMLQPVPGELQGSQAAGHTVIGNDNAARYAPYVAAFTDVDPQALVRSYRRFYPLIQQAYAELGAPDRYFNDRLIDVIDHLLRTPTPQQPIVVVADGRGRYRFADPALESLSVGQKALLRLGPTQQAAVAAQLQQVRAALVQGR